MKKIRSLNEADDARRMRLEEAVAEVLPAPIATARPARGLPPAGQARATVNVRMAKDQLSALLERAAEGEEIVITSDGRPKGMLVRYTAVSTGKVAGSMASLRRAMTQTPDSTDLIRAERDAGF